MDGIFFVLRSGCQWNALNETGICSSSTAHSRFQEWTKAGVFQKLWAESCGEKSQAARQRESINKYTVPRFCTKNGVPEFCVTSFKKSTHKGARLLNTLPEPKILQKYAKNT